MGVNDADHKSHPFYQAVTANETADDFTFIFQSLHLIDLEWQPTVLVANAAEVITIDFCQVFGKPVARVFCFFHMLHDIEKYLKVLPEGGTVGRIQADIDVLQTCSNDDTFAKAYNLVIR